MYRVETWAWSKADVNSRDDEIQVYKRKPKGREYEMKNKIRFKNKPLGR